MRPDPTVKPKDIFVLLDGTWNDSENGEALTNIVRLREFIRAFANSRQEQNPERDGGRPIDVYYRRGVGTGPFDRLSGGAFGLGLEDNIRNAYRYLSTVYRPGDRVFVFGFSRGAYTARSLVGYIAACGLLKPEYCTSVVEKVCWIYYRTAPHARLPGVLHRISQYTRQDPPLSIACIGVFDTVGALGIPSRYFWRFNRELYEFHDVTLSRLSSVCLHAIAIDEARTAFEATLWRRARPGVQNNTVEQVWFPGDHGDVGGCFDAALPGPADEGKLSGGLALSWMVSRLAHHFPDLTLANGTAAGASRNEAMQLHSSRHFIYRIQRRALRSIGNTTSDSSLPFRGVWVGFNRFDRAIGEMIHVSALTNLGKLITVDGRKERYLPANVRAVLPALEEAYARTDGAPHRLRLVDWDGSVLDHQKAEHLQKARSILERAKNALHPV